MERHDFLSDRDLYHMKKRQEINFQLPWSTEGAIFEKKRNTPDGASTNPKNFNLNKNLNMNLILIET